MRSAVISQHWKHVVREAEKRVPHETSRPAGYRMIAAWGSYRGHSLAYVQSVQQYAWARRLPVDVIEYRRGRWVTVGDLPAGLRTMIEAAANDESRIAQSEELLLRDVRTA